MATPQALSVGLGVVLRAVINFVFAQNEKLAGAFSGIWDGIVAYAAWRTDRLLEPLVLLEIVVGVCFDVLFHGSPTRLVSLALGSALGVVISDTAGLDALWDDLGSNVQEKLRDLDIKDDLDSPSVLSEFSEDMTVVYEEKRVASTPRIRKKMTTAEWIAAQQKSRARTSKSTSRRASASMNISTDLDKSLLLSGFDTQTQVTTTQTLSSRGRRDREVLATMTPLAPPSIASSDINIDVHPPSVSTRLSSPMPMIKTEIVEELSPRESNESVGIDISKPSSPPKSTASRSNRTARREATDVEPKSTRSASERPRSPGSPSIVSHHSRQLERQDVPPTRSEHSDHSTIKERNTQTPRSKHTFTDEGSFVPFIPPRPASTRAPTVISACHLHPYTPGRSPSQRSHRTEQATSFWGHATADVPSFVPFSANADLLERMTTRLRSRASTRHHDIERPAQDLAESVQDHRSTVRPKSSAHPASSSVGLEEDFEAYGPGGSSAVRSETEQPRASPPPPPAPEVIIDYSGDTTRIYIPPPAETGINVRIVPRVDSVEESQSRTQPLEETSDMLHPFEDRRSQTASGNHLPSHDISVFLTHSTGSFPELETVPPDAYEERSADDDDGQRSRVSHASRAGMSSDPQPPSTFKLNTAWRNSGSAPPPSLSSASAYGGRVAESGDPLPVYISEDFGEPSGILRVARSRPVSPISQPHSLRRSHLASSKLTHQNGNTTNTLDLDMHEGSLAPGPGNVVEDTKTPSVEWFGPVKSHRRRRSDVSHSHNRRSREVPIPIPIPRSEVGYRQSSSTIFTSPSVNESENILSPSSRRTKAALYTRAQQLDQQAKDMDKRCQLLRDQIREAKIENRNALAFTLGCDLEVAEERARKLHRRSDRVRDAARNVEPLDSDDLKVDVHNRNPAKAVTAVLTALDNVRKRGGSRLTVVADNLVQKNIIVDRLKKYPYEVRTDETDPSVIHIIVPQTS